jgi:hypothetical protein
MAAKKALNVLIMLIMVVIAMFNILLAINFIAASGQAFAAWFNSETIFLFAAVELVIVVVAYIAHRQLTAKKP